MPPSLALCLTIAFIAFLLYQDIRERPNVSAGLWFPILWMLIMGSRFVSEWLAVFGIQMGGVNPEDGSPLDAAIFFLIFAGCLYVLIKRRISISEVVRNNRWLTIYFAYCFIAIVWSDFPFVSLKRWIKMMGQPLMVVLILTEPDPKEAIVRIMTRCACILIPLSITFIKYFPQFGRVFLPWTGEAQDTGVATDKNMLGVLCMILGLSLFWQLYEGFITKHRTVSRKQLVLSFCLLALTGWTLSRAHSSTALVSLLVGIVTIGVLGQPWVKHQFIGTYILLGISFIVFSEVAFGVSTILLNLLGKDSTLTGRTEVWNDVLSVQASPLFGSGFESFWLGERLERIREIHWWSMNEAHNGYLETYLNLGWLGSGVLVGLLVATFFKIRRAIQVGSELGFLRLGFFIALLVYNLTEAGFRPSTLVFFSFCLIAMDFEQAGTASHLDSESSDSILDTVHDQPHQDFVCSRA
jgi:exopolysaccharide production protein ExoQ